MVNVLTTNEVDGNFDAVRHIDHLMRATSRNENRLAGPLVDSMTIYAKLLVEFLPFNRIEIETLGVYWVLIGGRTIG